MPRPLLCGNWKLNLGPAAAAALAHFLRDRLGESGDVDVAVFPTALSIPSVLVALAGSGIGVGIQEVAAIPSGALTGANSAVMARELGCTWMLAGHSERRQHFAETDEGVRDKVRAGLGAGLRPILCVGETTAERNAGRVDEVVLRQLAVGLEGLEPEAARSLDVAYEPVWAIGTGVTATPEQAQQVHASMRGWLRSRFPADVACGMRLLYGGSVNAGNAATLLACADIDGALVGGASLDVAAFAEIVAAARKRRS
jgi:triosephosphate isomerase